MKKNRHTSYLHVERFVNKLKRQIKVLKKRLKKVAKEKKV